MSLTKCCLIGCQLSCFRRHKDWIFCTHNVVVYCACVSVYSYRCSGSSLKVHVQDVGDMIYKSLLEACSDCLQLVWSRRDEEKNWIWIGTPLDKRDGTRWSVCEGGKVRLMTVCSQAGNLSPSFSLLGNNQFPHTSPSSHDNYYNN